MIKTTATGKARIYRKDYEGKAKYTTQLSKKDKDGNWANGFIGIQFNIGVELPDKTDIELTNAWIDFYVSKENKTVTQIRCTQFECEGLLQVRKPQIPEGFQALEDDDTIPF
jgi:hypothetical protein